MNRPSLIVLDRDGVLNKLLIDPEHGTIDSPLYPSQVEILEGVPEILARLTQAGYGLTIATNQPAFAKGKTTRKNLEDVHAKIVLLLEAQGARILSSHICFHRSEDRCGCRKPRTGLLEDAFRLHSAFDPKSSWMVGDGITDIQAGEAYGLKTAFVGPKKPDIIKMFHEIQTRPLFWAADIIEFGEYLLSTPNNLTRNIDMQENTQRDYPFASKIKIYSDGADLASMVEMAANPKIQGMTTNPTLMKKAKISDYRNFCQDALAKIKTKPISFEVFADDFDNMRRQALEIASWGSNVYVKIPIMNSEGMSSLELIQDLSHKEVKLNVTAILSLNQVSQTCIALKGGAPSIVSVFAGRIADTGRNPFPMMQKALEICQYTDKNIELLWASTREVLNIVQAEQAGCHIITVPPDLIKKMAFFDKDLELLSLETVQMFKNDADSAGFTL